MDVLILSKSFEAPGGVANFIHSIMAHLPADTRATHQPIGREPGREKDPATWLAPLRDNVRLARRVLRERPDCIHVNPSFNWPSLLRDGAFLLTLRLLRFHRCVVFFHGWDVDTAERVRRSRVRSWVLRQILRRVPVICVLASSFKQTLVDIGIEPERIHVVTTMYDPAIFDGVSRHSSEARVILFMGRLVPAKGARETLEAFAMLANEVPDVRLVIAGDGPQLDSLRQRSQALELADRVEFPGYLKGPAKGQALADADLFVFPTRYGEGCPVSLLEAMAAGLPTITTPVGGIPDIFADETNGTLLRREDPAALAGAMCRWLRDRAAAGACGARNREAAAQFAGDAVAARIARLYEVAAG